MFVCQEASFLKELSQSDASLGRRPRCQRSTSSHYSLLEPTWRSLGSPNRRHRSSNQKKGYPARLCRLFCIKQRFNPIPRGRPRPFQHDAPGGSTVCLPSWRRSIGCPCQDLSARSGSTTVPSRPLPHETTGQRTQVRVSPRVGYTARSIWSVELALHLQDQRSAFSRCSRARF